MLFNRLYIGMVVVVFTWAGDWWQILRISRIVGGRIGVVILTSGLSVGGIVFLPIGVGS